MHFVFPIMIRAKKEKGYITDEDLITFRVKPVLRMAGTMRTTSLYIDIKVFSFERQLKFCWRPEVTIYWLFGHKAVKFIRQIRNKK